MKKLVGLILVLAALALCSCNSTEDMYVNDPDETNSSSAVISGGLDVSLKYNGQEANDITAFFDGVSNWAPGTVAYGNFEIGNEGVLIFNYAMELYCEEAPELESLLRVAVVDGGIKGVPSDSELVALFEEADNDTAVNEFYMAGMLGVGETSGEVGVIIYFAPVEAETAEPVQSFEGEICVRVTATQLTAESDSFGNAYAQ